MDLGFIYIHIYIHIIYIYSYWLIIFWFAVVVSDV